MKWHEYLAMSAFIIAVVMAVSIALTVRAISYLLSEED